MKRCDISFIDKILIQRKQPLEEIMIENSKFRSVYVLAEASVQRAILSGLDVSDELGTFIKLTGFGSFTLQNSKFTNIISRAPNLLRLTGE